LLTEHMLFYASEKYPGEHEYTKYITEVHSNPSGGKFRIISFRKLFSSSEFNS
jgi:hypothetical protein